MTSLIQKLSEYNNLKGGVVTYGHFNTIHAGHIRYLLNAKKLKSPLIILVRGDSYKEKSIYHQFSQSDRSKSLAQLDIADFIIELEGNELKEAIKILKPSVIVLGKQQEKNPEPEMIDSYELIKESKIKIIYDSGNVEYASYELLNKSINEIEFTRIQELKEACSRQSIKYKDIIDSIEKWKNTKLIVLGDTIIDQYASCEPLGISAEAPVLVVKELQAKNFLGGAAIVASHIKTLGCKCKFISVVGNDKEADFLKEELNKMKMEFGLVVDKDRPTTFKKRYIVENQKIFRVSKLNDYDLKEEIEEKVLKELEKSAKSAQGIVISDFVYGLITPKILNFVKELSRQYNLMLFADIQCSSQTGFITKFIDFSLLCPNEKESRIAMNDKNGELEFLSKKIFETTNCQSLIMKLGAKGFITFKKNKDNSYLSQAFPALSVNPVDVAGAGDALLSAMATSITSGNDIMISSVIACCMASIAVETLGNKSIEKEQLIEKINLVLSD